ncbi:hypothetical protein [Flaviaesturariibacter amylovorans]|uniref:Uncharacterized protein n=1 Tax=Flaviaesturariibacter amylovorans TaxID=1084520 RepID=A0ABP8GQT0_9BACT
MKSFIQRNQVLLSAVLSAVVLTLQQLLTQKETSLKVVGFAVFIAVLGAIANQWKGRGVTVTGILGTLAGVVTNVHQSGSFTWNELVLSALVALLTAASSSLRPERHPRSARASGPRPVLHGPKRGPSYNKN